MTSTSHAPKPSDQAVDVRLIIDSLPTLAWVARLDGSAEFFNQRWLDYAGLSPEQSLDGGWQVAIHPDDLSDVLETIRHGVESQQGFEVEARFRRYDGELSPVSLLKRSDRLW